MKERGNNSVSLGGKKHNWNFTATENSLPCPQNFTLHFELKSEASRPVPNEVQAMYGTVQGKCPIVFSHSVNQEEQKTNTHTHLTMT